MEALILTIIATSIPLLLAATGELITEKSGVLNLGVEGMMLSGAVGALGAVLWLENPYFGIIAGALSGILMASIFSIFTINFMTNQVATGLGLTIFATGLTGLAGAPACGDVMKLDLKLNPDTDEILDVKFKTYGCGSAIASSTMFVEMLKGKTLEQAKQIKDKEIAAALELPPIKLHCSVLAEETIQTAIKDWEKKQAHRKHNNPPDVRPN